MIKIKGLSETKVIEICDKVAKNHQQKQFESFTEEDIYQQAWVIILEKIDEFTDKKIKEDNIEQALENFLNSIVSNRLSNFYRDKYVVKIRKRKNDSDTEHLTRLSLSFPINIADTEERADDKNDLVLYEKYIDILFQNLSDDGFDILESILSGEKISGYYKQKLLNEIKEISCD